MDNLQKEWNNKLSKEDVTIASPDDKKAPEPPAKTDQDAEEFARKRVEDIFNRMERMIKEKEKAEEDNRKDTIN